MAIARSQAPAVQEALRVVIVAGCGLALVLAGRALPF